MRVRLTRHAEADLDDIATFIARDNPFRALTFAEELYEKCMALADMPSAFPLIPRYEALGVRRRVHKDYLILFTVKGETISVLRVLHGARDYLPLVLGDPHG
ncbi:MAG: type II toxin-antitoxin system RelE/ParE family toxin [Rhodanobacteraceae bacterium]